MDISRATFSAFSDALAALYATPDQEERGASLIPHLHAVFTSCRISIDAMAPGAKVAVEGRTRVDRRTLVVPITGTGQRLILRRSEGFSAHELFLADRLRAHLEVAFGNRRPVPAKRARPIVEPGHLRGLGLTVRECEVLHWIVRGKRDAEIAAIVHSSLRTVHKHVEHILRKLSVETRLSAARVAAEWLARVNSAVE